MNVRIRIRNPKIKRIVSIVRIVVLSTFILFILGQMIYFKFIQPRQERMGIPVYYNYKERIDNIENETVYENDQIKINIYKLETLKDCIEIKFSFQNKTSETYEFNINNVKINGKEVIYNHESFNEAIRVIPNTTEYGYEVVIKHYELDRNEIGKISTISFNTTIQDEEIEYKVS